MISIKAFLIYGTLMWVFISGCGFGEKKFYTRRTFHKNVRIKVPLDSIDEFVENRVERYSLYHDDENRIRIEFMTDLKIDLKLLHSVNEGEFLSPIPRISDTTFYSGDGRSFIVGVKFNVSDSLIEKNRPSDENKFDKGIAVAYTIVGTNYVLTGEAHIARYYHYEPNSLAKSIGKSWPRKNAS